MKKVFLIFAFVLSCPLVFSQAKRNLQAKKSSFSKETKKTAAEAPAVINEDYEKGRELFQLNKPDEAIPHFVKALDDENVNPEIWIQLGVAYYQTGDFRNSLACCTRGLSRPGTDRKVLSFNAGNSAWALGNYARAEACYTLAIEEDSGFAPAYLNKANSQLKQDHLKEALSNYKKYAELEPDSPQKNEIARLCAMLEEEIARRENEKPELIDFAATNVKNNEMIAETKSEEKIEIPPPAQETVPEKVSAELVILDTFEEPPKPEKNASQSEITPKKIDGGFYLETDFPDKEKTEIKAEIVAKETAVPEAPGNPAKQSISADEKFSGEMLPDAVMTIPAGEVKFKSESFGFSPDAKDSEKRKEYFSAEVKNPGNVASYRFEIVDDFGAVVKTSVGTVLPKRFEWDGKTDSGGISGGRYKGRLTVAFKTGGSVTTESGAFSVFTEKPSVSVVPDFIPQSGDGSAYSVSFKVDVKSDALIREWNFEISRNGKAVYNLNGNVIPRSFEWDGKTSSGETVEQDGELTFKMTVTDVFGIVSACEGKISDAKQHYGARLQNPPLEKQHHLL